jgi:hypothetical protein
MRRALVSLIAGLLLLGVASRAHAIPSFARQYGTSCQTCHTVYPKLTPFGEAFRRNGFKFPGKDSDFIKIETLPLGNEAYRQLWPKDSVWPSWIALFSTLAFGVNGSVIFHPQNTAGAAVADNGAYVSLHDLVLEGHLWGGGGISEHIAYFTEVTFASDHTIDLEHAELHFDDLFGPKHFFNIYVGRGFPTLTSFAPHSSYVADTIMPQLSVTGLFGATSDSFSALNEYNLVELNGMLKGRFIYSVGVHSGANLDVRNAQNVYGHLGYKLGGMRLDGEGDTQGNPTKPWAENALTFDVYGMWSASHFQPAASALVPVGTVASPLDDTTSVVGGHLRGTLGSFELDYGMFYEWHEHATADGTAVQAMAQYGEVSYVVLPWLVPAFRIEWAQLRPQGQATINDLKLIPGIDALVRPNLKITLTALIEHADGVPSGGWGAWGGSAAPMMGSVTEVENILLGLAYAF